MSVMYKSVARIEPGVLGGGQSKYYATIVRERPVELRKFATEISRTSLLSTTDVFAVLESFIDNMYVYLEEGRIIRLGDFGTFTPSINSTGSELPEQVSRASIRRFKINFRPGPFLRKRLAHVEFDKVPDDTVDEPEAS